MYLAARLMHRSAQTDLERSAAEYLRDRFKSYTGDVEIDDFFAIENPTYLFASYYAEFLVVSILAIWWPLFSLCYGAIVFLAYLAEFMGFPIFSRLLPQYETQNVVTRFMGRDPRRLFIVTAYYDSGSASPLSNPGIVPWLRPAHFLMVACMALVLATCAVDAFVYGADGGYPFVVHLRWSAVGILLSAAIVLFYISTQHEDIRGANGNASGVSGLLSLAERFSERPLENASLWLVATGSHEGWMSGIRHFLATHRHLDKQNTFFINLESVGAGRLHYLTAEGMLHLYPADPDLLFAARECAPAYGATPATLSAVPSGAHILLSRGFRTASIMGLDEQQLPVNWNWYDDKVTQVDEASIARAAAYAEAILRRLDLASS